VTKGSYFPKKLHRYLEREIDFAKGKRNPVAIGPKILQEAN